MLISSLGSKIAKSGFNNERDVKSKFDNWQKDTEAQQWLEIMGYDLNEIEYVKAEILHGYKTDVQVQVTIKLKKVIDVENLQVKLVSIKKPFNQVDKRWIDTYQELWQIPDDVVDILKRYTGELPPSIKKSNDKRRMNANEFSIDDQKKVIAFLKLKRALIINDIIKGRGKFAAEWILVIQKLNNVSKWALKPINLAINHYLQGEVKISLRGCFHLGPVTMQRKGGDRGAKTANMLQFKLNPAELFDI